MPCLSGSVIVLAVFWVASVPCLGHSPGPGCDNGKVLLDTDLPKDAAQWHCPTPLWPKSLRLYSVDTVYDPEPAKMTCMDQDITFSHTIPNSGAFRPVSAERGEYLFCPPQRWLSNLYRGATVLLYHPCSPLDERQLLSALAQSCISDFILTPHKNLDKNSPIAFVSWGRTLEVSTAASSGICDWLNWTSSSKTNAGEMTNKGEITHKQQYHLLLTRSVEQDKHKENKGSLKQCCEQIISSLTEDMKKTPKHSSFKNGRLRQIEKKVKRAAIKPTSNFTQIFLNWTTEISHKHQSNGLQETILSRNTVDRDSTKDAHSKSINSNKSPKDLMPKISWTTPNSISVIHPQMQLQKLSSNKMGKNHNNGNVRSNNVFRSIVKHRGGGLNTVAANSKDNEVIDVEEREADNMNNDAKTQQSSNGLDSSTKSQPVSYIPSDNDDCQCKASQTCECHKGARDQNQAAAGMRDGFQRTPRTDDAVWAAGALGFLLVLLTLSILHTRLYKHWRRGTSLYWHDPRQDYDSVADVIRRRLRLTKTRRKRSRKKECVLQPSSSSSEEYP